MSVMLSDKFLLYSKSKKYNGCVHISSIGVVCISTYQLMQVEKSSNKITDYHDNIITFFDDGYFFVLRDLEIKTIEDFKDIRPKFYEEFKKNNVKQIEKQIFEEIKKPTHRAAFLEL